MLNQASIVCLLEPINLPKSQRLKYYSVESNSISTKLQILRLSLVC